jgi:hypothetical protein
MELIYQPDGFTDDSRSPTEEHIREATLNALRVPVQGRIHHRMWFPHRSNRVSEFWRWMSDNTTFIMDGTQMRNCGHVAVWCLTPETEETRAKWREAKKHGRVFDTPRSDRAFVDNDGNLAWYSNWMAQVQSSPDTSELQMRIRDYYTAPYMQSYEYAQSLRTRGYHVGFAACVMHQADSFSKTFASGLGVRALVPIIAVYAGTKPTVVHHKPERDNLDHTDIGAELVHPDLEPVRYSSMEDDSLFVDGYRYCEVEGGSLRPISQNDALNKFKILKRKISIRQRDD